MFVALTRLACATKTQVVHVPEWIWISRDETSGIVNTLGNECLMIPGGTLKLIQQHGGQVVVEYAPPPDIDVQGGSFCDSGTQFVMHKAAFNAYETMYQELQEMAREEKKGYTKRWG